jgi:hypothetical protein
MDRATRPSRFRAGPADHARLRCGVEHEIDRDPDDQAVGIAGDLQTVADA